MTETEKAVAWTILKHARVPELDVLRIQLEAAVATEPCGCGCPSVSISVDPGRAEPTSYSGRPVADAHYDDGAVMVWVDDGWLSNLEIYWYETQPIAFPPLDALRDFSRY